MNQGHLFPVELWTIILHHATNVSTELGIAEWNGNYNPLDLGRIKYHDTILPTILLRHEVSRRLSLSLVCHVWYSMLRPLLYRSILIDNDNALQGFTRLLHRSEDSISPLVRRVDICSSIMDTTATRFLWNLLKECPNLVFIGDRPSLSIHHILRQSFNNSHGEDQLPRNCISQLSFHDVYWQSLPPLWISSFHNLRAFQLANSFDFGQLDIDLQIPLCFPNLEILDLSRMVAAGTRLDQYMAKWALPRLHSLSVRIGQVYFYRRFMSNVGPQIRTIHHDKTELEPSSFYNANYGVSCYPNLEQLIVLKDVWEQIIIDYAQYSPKIARVEFKMTGEKGQKLNHNVDRMDFPSLFPELQTVRFSNLPSSTEADNNSWLHNFLIKFDKTLQSNGVSFFETLVDGRTSALSAEFIEKILETAGK